MASAPPRIRTAVVGTGLSAQVFHLPFILDNPAFHLVAVVSRSGQPPASPPLPADVTLVRGLDELPAGGGVDLVVLSTPPETHFDMASAALRRGMHVLVEKPVCATSQEAAELDLAARQAGRVVSVFHNRRFDSDFMTVRDDVLSSGRLGDVVEVEMHFDRHRLGLRDGWKEAPGRPGGGLLYDLGSHLADQSIALFGAPAAVTASVLRQRPGTAVDDGFHVVLHYPGRLVTLRAGMLIAPPRPRFALYGTMGSFVKHGLDVQEPQLRAGMTLHDVGFAVEPPENAGTLTIVEAGSPRTERVPTRVGSYKGYYAALARAIQEGAPPPVSASEGAMVIRVIEKAYQSHAERRTVPWD